MRFRFQQFKFPIVEARYYMVAYVGTLIVLGMWGEAPCVKCRGLHPRK